MFIIYLIPIYLNFIILPQDKVTLEIVDENGNVKEVSFEWPFSGPPPIGDNSSLAAKVEEILKENDVDCPPERTKVSDYVWRCGNGKLVRTKDRKVGRLLSKAWDE